MTVRRPVNTGSSRTSPTETSADAATDMTKRDPSLRLVRTNGSRGPRADKGAGWDVSAIHGSSAPWVFKSNR